MKTRKLRHLVGLIAATLFAVAADAGSPLSAADFRYQEWFGTEDWDAEACRAAIHVTEGMFFYVEQDWQGRFNIGVYASDWKIEDDFVIDGAVAFDSRPPMVLKGKAQKGNRLLFAFRSDEELKERFASSNVLRLSFGEGWAVIPLRGSRRVATLLTRCAEKVWPGAGDDEDSGESASRTTLYPVFDPTAIKLPTEPAIGRCHMGGCSWGMIKSIRSSGETKSGRGYEIEMLGGSSQHPEVADYPKKYSPYVKIEWDTSVRKVGIVCNLAAPTVVVDGQVSILDFSQISGAQESDANVYVQVCHGEGAYEWATDGWASAKGYR